MSVQPRPGGPAPRFGILGPLRLEVGGGEVPLRSPKQRSLLAALLMDVGVLVPSDRLAEILWAARPPDDPAGAVHTHVSRLRRVLHDHGGQRAAELVVTRPPGYALLADGDMVDAGRFERLVGEARAAATPEAAVELTRAALRLWRGTPLPEIEHERAIAEAARLEELRATAWELRADAMLRLGRAPEVVAELELPITRHPFRERLRGQQMVALYRSGRQAEALAAYRELRGRLVDELGVEPSPALRTLEQRILQQVEHLPWPVSPEDGAASGADRAERPALPEELTTPIGREADVRGVVEALRARRVVVLTGVGGVGKSRLARRVAREPAGDHADGVVWCDLVGAATPEAVPEVVSTALGVLPSGRGSLAGLVELLRRQRLLLVLDNCEHVRRGASGLVQRILESCPGVDVLATSRQPLDLAAGQVWPVRPLGLAPGDGGAVELFRDRAERVDPTVRWTGADRAAVAEICRRLDGLPLAIELAAARTRSMTPADIAGRLDHRFDLLTEGPGTGPPRHRSLQAALDWSYDLLPVAARQVFDRLAVFAGGFSADAAARVCAGGAVPADAVADRVAELVDHCLVSVDRSGRNARYRLLESLRAHGEAHLGKRGELDTWTRRHAEHCTSLAVRAADGLHGPDEGRWVRLLDTEFANIRVAQHRACASGQLDVALRLPGLLCDYGYYRLRPEVHGWSERALELPGASAHPFFPAALLTAAVGHMQRGALDRALEAGARVLAAATDERLVLRATQLLAEVALYQGRLDDTERRGQELQDRAASAADPYFEALGHLYRIHAAAYGGRAEAAAERLGTGWRVAGRAGTPTLRAGFSYLEGEIRLDAAPEVALAAFRQAIQTARSVGNRFVVGVTQVSVAALQARHGSPEEALASFREIIDSWRRCGDWVHLWTAVHNLLVLFERAGAHEAAAVLHGAVRTASTGAPPFGGDAERLRHTAAALRRTLGEQAFAAADARGRCMSDEDAVGFAREVIGDLLVGVPA